MKAEDRAPGCIEGTIVQVGGGPGDSRPGHSGSHFGPDVTSLPPRARHADMLEYKGYRGTTRVEVSRPRSLSSSRGRTESPALPQYAFKKAGQTQGRKPNSESDSLAGSERSPLEVVGVGVYVMKLEMAQRRPVFHRNTTGGRALPACPGSSVAPGQAREGNAISKFATSGGVRLARDIESDGFGNSEDKAEHMLLLVRGPDTDRSNAWSNYGDRAQATCCVGKSCSTVKRGMLEELGLPRATGGQL
ncbi:hypothetical protein EJ06DRAFT_521575 [Trichodelitschia bisporula]|uniref:Uncharacterized protein n=1 Tax=Trichodelitschia bisporula TaxID=703511 RepID=A0A6G1HYL6_9PEZI|nr:hypothetical protein EJ06DRAFT_521575 [Trichodelitschia bisporula]